MTRKAQSDQTPEAARRRVAADGTVITTSGGPKEDLS
jgi:hypothetical protein